MDMYEQMGGLHENHHDTTWCGGISRRSRLKRLSPHQKQTFLDFKIGEDGIDTSAKVAEYFCAVETLRVPTIAGVEGGASARSWHCHCMRFCASPRDSSRFGVPICAATLGKLLCPWKKLCVDRKRIRVRAYLKKMLLPLRRNAHRRRSARVAVNLMGSGHAGKYLDARIGPRGM
jgi:hypothetical protein